MTAIDGELFFTANDGIHGREPWRLTSNDPIPGDTNNDGRVDATDLNTLGIHWQQEVFGASHGDFNDDGRVDAEDLNLLALNWRTGTQQNALLAATAPVRRVPVRPTPRAALKREAQSRSDLERASDALERIISKHSLAPSGFARSSGEF